ncbi:unnamed protein product [Mytilus coruscus]|uniref:Uncharacterized protein n=1 Tax=Mytilus coruscus TaxID=42192 RepID=A0A6J8EHE6_MYTCO|nr:unnamed protein product [Mytilus coruscus]
MFNKGKETKSNWKDAFNSCTCGNLANYGTVMGKINEPQFSANFWLSNTRRWTRIKGTSFSSRIENTSPSLRSKIFQGLTISEYSASLRSTFSSRFVSSTPTPKKTMSRSKVVDLRSTFSSQFMSTTPAMKKTTGRHKVVQETTSSSPDLKETASPDLVESSSTDLPGKDGVSAIVIIAIVAATILIVIFILVTVVVCRRKKNTQVPISNESLAMVGKEVVYAQVNKPTTVKREKSASSQKSQPTASDDTYDHMDHCRLSQTHNPTESNYDTMRNIANSGEEENNYDHVPGTKMEPERFVVDGASNYSHVEVEFHEVKDI